MTQGLSGSEVEVREGKDTVQLGLGTPKDLLSSEQYI